MKKFLLLIATILISSPLLAEGKMKSEVTNSFTDKVKNIKVEEKEIVVQFVRHAALYKMQKMNPRFEELKTKLEKLKAEEKKVKITAIIPSMEIKDITE